MPTDALCGGVRRLCRSREPRSVCGAAAKEIQPPSTAVHMTQPCTHPSSSLVQCLVLSTHLAWTLFKLIHRVPERRARAAVLLTRRAPIVNYPRPVVIHQPPFACPYESRHTAPPANTVRELLQAFAGSAGVYLTGYARLSASGSMSDMPSLCWTISPKLVLRLPATAGPST